MFCIVTKKCYNKKRPAYVVLISVLVVGAFGTALAMAVLLSGINSAKSGLLEQQSANARALANACAEEALGQIRADKNYNGSGNLNIDNDTCIYTVILGSGDIRDINVTATSSVAIRKIFINITQINPSIQVSVWREVN
ncbi:hypothetical protein COT94_02350 [Candidatus Falkowbacteria bacterium CG10_big_fil_rev_8_21_14_0_10_37_14]|uniref:Uncharacterized protein n=1 Tax=Candidatus Falkowbacteria bacterium CG10_big_fil_rev_8_21_14_0_10_37_14 TaxID=1974561 RepID=A0A2M6WTK2_9BACT|nr:hypothetical protein [Candidatus Falkowbacteria bacterium]PIT96081.1 MAG: hypothetical protein COT94_02350 [Candidatus Falkowbacteria bacterium CG10_big_fil_rev_8_21_14_0_10_37_14]